MPLPRASWCRQRWRSAPVEWPGPTADTTATRSITPATRREWSIAPPVDRSCAVTRATARYHDLRRALGDGYEAFAIPPEVGGTPTTRARLPGRSDLLRQRQRRDGRALREGTRRRTRSGPSGGIGLRDQWPWASRTRRRGVHRAERVRRSCEPADDDGASSCMPTRTCRCSCCTLGCGGPTRMACSPTTTRRWHRAPPRPDTASERSESRELHGHASRLPSRQLDRRIWRVTDVHDVSGTSCTSGPAD